MGSKETGRCPSTHSWPTGPAQRSARVSRFTASGGHPQNGPTSRPRVSGEPASTPLPASSPGESARQFLESREHTSCDAALQPPALGVTRRDQPLPRSVQLRGLTLDLPHPPLELRRELDVSQGYRGLIGDVSQHAVLAVAHATASAMDAEITSTDTAPTWDTHALRDQSRPTTPPPKRRLTCGDTSRSILDQSGRPV